MVEIDPSQAQSDRRDGVRDPAGVFLAEFARRAPAFAARPKAESDDAFLYTLFAAVQAEALPLPEPLVAIQFQSQRMTYAEQFPAAMDLIVERDARPIGRFTVDWTAPGHVQGIDMAVLPGERRGAPGLHLLRAWTTICDACGRPARLSVRPGNPAIKLYYRMGFLKVVKSTIPIVMERPAHPLTTDESIESV